MTSARRRLFFFTVVVFASALFASACDGGGAPSASPSPSTTTLPPPLRVANSGVGGPFGAVGPVYRIAVDRLGRNRIAPRPSAAQSVANTVVLAYRQFGSGPNLLLISGEHSTMTTWDPKFLLELASHFTVTEFDFPDVGYSAPDDRYSSVAALADDTAGLVWALGLTKPTVFGWGFGGEVALSLVERHPGLVWRLVLADATSGGPEATQPSDAVAATLASPLVTPTEMSYVEFPIDADAARVTWLADTSKVTADVMTAAAVAHEAEVVANGYRSDTVAEDLGSVGIPTLILQGGQDIVIPENNAYTLEALLPHARLVMFAQGGYGSIFEDSPTVLDDVEAFVNQ
jgi:pimeloyl-ACP methyl ester carboxylesterase